MGDSEIFRQVFELLKIFFFFCKFKLSMKGYLLLDFFVVHLSVKDTA